MTPNLQLPRTVPSSEKIVASIRSAENPPSSCHPMIPLITEKFHGASDRKKIYFFGVTRTVTRIGSILREKSELKTRNLPFAFGVPVRGGYLWERNTRLLFTIEESIRRGQEAARAGVGTMNDERRERTRESTGPRACIVMLIARVQCHRSSLLCPTRLRLVFSSPSRPSFQTFSSPGPLSGHFAAGVSLIT